MNEATFLPVTIHRCVVTKVNTDRHTCELTTLDDAARRYSEVPWTTGLADQRGNGIDVCPSVGYVCYAITRTSNMQSEADDSSAIIAWEPPVYKEGKQGRDREVMAHGDVKLSTRKGGRVLLAANSGDVIVQAGPANSIIMYRLANLLEVLTDELNLKTAGGHLRWGSVGTEHDGDSVYYDCHVKNNVGDEAGFFRVSMSDGEVRVQVTDPTNVYDSVDAVNSVDMNGTPGIHVNVEMTNKGVVSVHARERLNLSASTKVTLKTQGYLTQECSRYTLENKNPTTDKTGRVVANSESYKSNYTLTELTSSQFKVINRSTGETLIHTADEEIVEGKNKRLLTEDLIDWLFNHTHPTSNGPTLAPLGAPLDASMVEQPGGSTAVVVQEAEQDAINKNVSDSITGTVVAGIVTILNSIPLTQPGVEALVQSMVASEVLDEGSTVLDLVSRLTQSAQKSAENAVTLANNVAVTPEQNMAPQPFSIESVNDIMTVDTKVR